MTDTPAAAPSPRLVSSQESIAQFFQIPPVVIVFRPSHGPAFEFCADRSNVVLARLFTAAHNGERIVALSSDGRDADADSIAALNCFLRAGRAMGRMRHPWHRIGLRPGLYTKFEWRELVEHLGLEFSGQTAADSSAN